MLLLKLILPVATRLLLTSRKTSFTFPSGMVSIGDSSQPSASLNPQADSAYQTIPIIRMGGDAAQRVLASDFMDGVARRRRLQLVLAMDALMKDGDKLKEIMGCLPIDTMEEIQSLGYDVSNRKSKRSEGLSKKPIEPKIRCAGCQKKFLESELSISAVGEGVTYLMCQECVKKVTDEKERIT